MTTRTTQTIVRFSIDPSKMKAFDSEALRIGGPVSAELVQDAPGVLANSRMRADLTGAQLKRANLTGANLTKTQFRRAQLQGADLSGTIMTQADLRGADLTGVTLSNAILKDADLRDVILDEVDFSNANTEGCRGCPQSHGSKP